MFLDLTHYRCFQAMFDIEAYGFLFHVSFVTPVESWLILNCTIAVLVNTVVLPVPDGKEDAALRLICYLRGRMRT